MTTIEFLAMLARRWYVVVAGGLMTVLAVVVLVGQSAPVYWTSTTVVVVRPVSRATPNALQNQELLTPVASLLVLRFNGGPTKVRPAGRDAPLYGRGVRHAEQVQVRNLGSQWAPQIQDPNIDIQVVEESAEAVQVRLAQITQRLAVLLEQVQDEVLVPSSTRMSLAVGVPAPVVEIPVNARRAQVVLLLLGGVLTAVAIRVIDALARRRSADASAAGARPLAGSSHGSREGAPC